MKEVEVDEGDGCVSPTADTIADGSYPLSAVRCTSISNDDKLATDERRSKAFVDYYLTNEGS